MSQPEPRLEIRYSVVIPAFNAERYLDRLGPWLRRTVMRPRTEVIVVDDASQDNTAGYLSGIDGLILLKQPINQGPAAARNQGAEIARGHVLVFFDADTLPANDALDRIERWDQDHPDEDAIIGSYDASPEVQSTVSRFKNLFHRFVHQQGQTFAGTFWTGCGAMRTRRFRELGGFDTALYRRPSIEDIELGMRLVEDGGKIRLDRHLCVQHRKRWGFVELVRTDVWQRGIPWTHLCLRSRKMHHDLNLRWEHRVSVAAAVMATFGLLLGGVGLVPWPAALTTVTFGLVVVSVLNRDFYAYLSKIGGWWFAARSIVLHWTYCLYCAVAFGLGIVTYPWVKHHHQAALEKRSRCGDPG